jgi:hypothetical protein
MGGWGGFLDKLLGKLPIQDRRERWKNQIDDLIKSKNKILDSEWNEKKALRVTKIDEKIEHLNQLIKNAL